MNGREGQAKIGSNVVIGSKKGKKEASYEALQHRLFSDSSLRQAAKETSQHCTSFRGEASKEDTVPVKNRLSLLIE